MIKKKCRNDGAEMRIFWDEPMDTAFICPQCLEVTTLRQFDVGYKEMDGIYER